MTMPNGFGHAVSPPGSQHLHGLDVLRAAAIVWVMLYHASLFGFVSGEHWLVAFGWMGVDLFFVLSGFLIAGQLLQPLARGMRPDYRRFLRRRMLRTLPAYLAVLSVYVLLPHAREYDAIQPAWQFLTFTENLFIRVPPPKAFSHVWSLCVEEQFYLVFPAALALLAVRPSPARIVAAILGVLLLGIALRGHAWLHELSPRRIDGVAGPDFGPAYLRSLYYPTWTRLDGLLAGIVAALVRIFRPRVWHAMIDKSGVCLIAGLLGVAVSMGMFSQLAAGPLPSLFGFPLLSVSLAAIVVAGCGRHAGWVRIPGAALLARYAYSLYLSHKLVFHAIETGTIPVARPGLVLATALAGSLVVGSLLYRLVEQPFLMLRDRLDAPVRFRLAVPAPVDGPDT